MDTLQAKDTGHLTVRAPWPGAEQGGLGAPGPGDTAAMEQPRACRAQNSQLGLSWEDGMVCVHGAAL